MEQIKLTQTQTLSSAGNAIGEFEDNSALAPAAIDERLIADNVLRVRWGHRKGVRCIVKGKWKVFATLYLALSSGSQSQAVEEQRHLGMRIDAQQLEINTLKAMIA